MANEEKKSTGNDINMDDKTPLDLRGSEQHHDLKNNPGEDGDPDDASDSAAASDEMSEAVKKATPEENEETAISSALKKATDD